MPAIHSIPLILIGILLGLLFGLMIWGFWRTKWRQVDNSLLDSHDDVLLGLLVLGAFAMGVFLTYTLLNFNFF